MSCRSIGIACLALCSLYAAAQKGQKLVKASQVISLFKYVYVRAVR